MQDFPPPNPADRAPKIKSTIRGGVPSAPRPIITLDKATQPPPYTEPDPAPPMGMQRPKITLSDAERQKPEPKVTSLQKPRPILKKLED